MGSEIQQENETDRIIVNDEFSVSVAIVRCTSTPTGLLCWKLRLDTALGTDITIVVRMDSANHAPLDYYLFPRIDIASNRVRLAEENGLIVEKAGSGISLWQNVRRAGHRWIVLKKPEGSKQDRASQQSPKFERGEIWVPREALWLQTFEDELASFPHGRHDDQVDSAVQFLAAMDTGHLLRMADQARRR